MCNPRFLRLLVSGLCRFWNPQDFLPLPLTARSSVTLSERCSAVRAPGPRKARTELASAVTRLVGYGPRPLWTCCSISGVMLVA